MFGCVQSRRNYQSLDVLSEGRVGYCDYIELAAGAVQDQFHRKVSPLKESETVNIWLALEPQLDLDWIKSAIDLFQ